MHLLKSSVKYSFVSWLAGPMIKSKYQEQVFAVCYAFSSLFFFSFFHVRRFNFGQVVTKHRPQSEFITETPYKHTEDPDLLLDWQNSSGNCFHASLEAVGQNTSRWYQISLLNVSSPAGHPCVFWCRANNRPYWIRPTCCWQLAVE